MEMKSGPAFPANWIRAAAYERDRRANSYPRLIAAGEINEQRATLDYQAWCCIAEWMEAGRSKRPLDLVSWAALEQAAETALANIEARVAEAPGDTSADQARVAALRDRRDAVWCIHNTLVKQRESLEPTCRPDTAWARPPAETARVPQGSDA